VKSRYSHILMLLGAIAAFLPVMAVDYLLDSYVRLRERAQLQRGAEIIAERVQATAYDTIASLRRILAESPSLCTPTFLAHAQRAIGSSLYLKQMLVENADGVQFCDALGRPVKYVRLSETLSIPGQTETIEVVRLEELDMPVLRLVQAFGTRKVSAFAPLLGAPVSSLTAGLKPAAIVRISLTNGTPVLAGGDQTAFDQRGQAEYLLTEAFPGELPIRIEAAVPFAIARADYADLDTGLTLIACIVSGAFFVLALQYVRRSDLPAFDLDRAISAGEIKPYYQPVINLRTGELAGCEVLCRWQKKNGEIIYPGAFIEYAEVTGLAIPMTLSLMQQVKADLADLCSRAPDLKVSVNLFDGHFRDGNIVEDVKAIFGGTAISFRQLVFEITERRPLDNSAQTNSVIAGLHALGCRLAMDDAGTGHSNLAYMQTLGIDIIKIDRVFIDMINPQAGPVPVLDGLITMARELGTEIVAEGVETEEQARYLKARGVVMAQGYLFAPALRAAAFRELAQALNTSAAAGPGRRPQAA
jgi:EAL domain-containing protein (putative c-di-GMP-specific phosphodiesterase class I)